jgi:hypothetical protein
MSSGLVHLMDLTHFYLQLDFLFEELFICNYLNVHVLLWKKRSNVVETPQKPNDIKNWPRSGSLRIEILYKQSEALHIKNPKTRWLISWREWSYLTECSFLVEGGEIAQSSSVFKVVHNIIVCRILSPTESYNHDRIRLGQPSVENTDLLVLSWHRVCLGIGYVWDWASWTFCWTKVQREIRLRINMSAVPLANIL